MTLPSRPIKSDVLRRCAEGDPSSLEEVTSLLKSELRASSPRFEVQAGNPAPSREGTACLDVVAAAQHLSVKLLAEPTQQELRAAFMAGLAHAVMDLLRASTADASLFAPTILLSPASVGSDRRIVRTTSLIDALTRMEQLKGGGSLLAVLCLVLDQSVDEAARALQTSTDLAQMEWNVSREWLARELNLVTEATDA